MSTFVQRAVAGEFANPQDAIEDAVRDWHRNPYLPGMQEPLHVFLGMTWAEYARWVEQPDTLDGVLVAHGPHPHHCAPAPGRSPCARRHAVCSETNTVSCVTWLQALAADLRAGLPTLPWVLRFTDPQATLERFFRAAPWWHTRQLWQVVAYDTENAGRFEGPESWCPTWAELDAAAQRWAAKPLAWPEDES